MKRKTQEEFIQQAKEVHPEYDYSLVDYINSTTKVKIICPTHGEFEITPSSLLQNHGCYKCSFDKLASAFSKSKEEFIQQAKEVHPEYDYSKVDYINNKTKVKIICKEHGEYNVSPNGFLQGNICPLCNLEKIRKTQEKFIEEAKQIFPEYDYKNTKYTNRRTKVIVSCPRHGDFLSSPNGLLKGVGCPRCNSSKGEKSIRKYLQEKNIIFKEQYKIKDCKNKKPLPFDFAILNEDGSLAGLIEYQGKQHYEPIGFFGGEKTFSYLQTNDSIKRNYCNLQMIPYIEVSYEDNTVCCLDNFLQLVKKLAEKLKQ